MVSFFGYFLYSVLVIPNISIIHEFQLITIGIILVTPAIDSILTIKGQIVVFHTIRSGIKVTEGIIGK